MDLRGIDLEKVHVSRFNSMLEMISEHASELQTIKIDATMFNLIDEPFQQLICFPNLKHLTIGHGSRCTQVNRFKLDDHFGKLLLQLETLHLHLIFNTATFLGEFSKFKAPELYNVH